MTDENSSSESGATPANSPVAHGPMTDGARSGAVPAPDPTDPEAIRADIERTRSELSDTVNQLSEKLNPKTQAADKVTAAKQAVAERAAKAKAAAPPQVQRALDQAGTKAAPVARQVAEKAEPHRNKIIAGAVAGVLVLRFLRRRKSGDDA